MLRSKFTLLNRMKISNKLSLLYSSMVVSILLIFVAFTVLAVYIYGNIRNSHILTVTATTVANSITQKEHLFQNNWDDITVGNDLYIVIYSEDGTIIRKPDELSLDDDLIEDASLEIIGEVFKDGFFDDAAYINRLIKIEDEIFIIQIIKDYRNEIYMIAFMSATLGVLLILGAALSIVIGRKMSRQMLRPIGTMIENANNIQLFGVSSERLTLGDKKDEITDLGSTINAMLDRIESYSNTLTQFVSDASHELRTPLTVVLSNAEMVKKWAKDDKEALEKAIDSIEREALGMKILIERLLTLAKSDSGNLVLQSAPLEFDALIDEVFEETQIIAQNRAITLSCNDKITLDADYHRLKELLRIILDNAIKYTKEDGKIEISSKICGGTTLIVSVLDNGIGIKKADQAKIFDRFFCSEASRNKKKSGSGLGLAIAKSLAKELGFSISVESVEGEYTIFTLTKKL